MSLLSFKYAAAQTLVPSKWAEEGRKKHLTSWRTWLTHCTNRLMDSPNNNTITVNKATAHLLLSSRSCWYNNVQDVPWTHGIFLVVDVRRVSHENKEKCFHYSTLRLHTCCITCGQFLSLLKPSVWCTKNILSHIIHAIQHCYLFSVLMKASQDQI